MTQACPSRRKGPSGDLTSSASTWLEVNTMPQPWLRQSDMPRCVWNRRTTDAAIYHARELHGPGAQGFQGGSRPARQIARDIEAIRGCAQVRLDDVRAL